MAERYTIGALAQQAAVNVETIRYYQRRGLIPEPDKPLGGIRHYAADHLRRLRFVRQAQQLGFSLDEVAELLALDDGCHCRQVEAIAIHKLAIVRERLAQFRRMEKALSTLVNQCHRNTGKLRCPLIASLETEGAGERPGRSVRKQNRRTL